VLAEIALWKAFDEEPIWTPFIILSSILLLYDYLYQLPFEIYGILIVGVATLGGLLASLRGRYLLAAEYAGESDEDGIPAELRLKAVNVASSTVTLVFIAVGVIFQMIATSGLVGNEILGQNRLSGSSIPSILPISFILICLYFYGYFKKSSE
jgi:hypothetical protein